MKIIFFTRRFYPLIGGVEKHVLELSKCLVELGHDLTVITEEHEDKNSPNYHSGEVSATLTGNLGKIRIHRIGVGKDNWFKKFRIWKSIWDFRQELLSADVVHCHDVFFWYLPFRLLYPHKKVFTTFHGYEMRFPPTKKSIIVRKVSELLSFGNICIGDYLNKWYKSKPTLVSYGAVDKQPGQKSTPSKRTDELKILLIGRLEKDIGIDTYLKGLEILRKKGFKFRLDVCGDGSYREKLSKYGAVHGFVRNTEGYIRRSDAVFASSYLAILEAIYNVKLIYSVYDNNMKYDILTMTPFHNWITIVNSSEELASDVMSWQDHPLNNEKALKESRKWISEQTWDKMTELYLKLWQRNKSV